MTKKVVIVGGGAAGMMAAIAAGEGHAEVTLLEKKEQIGKKLLKTGNGKCNYSNFYLTERNYHTHHPEFVAKTVRRFHTDDLVRFFENAGMLSYAKDTALYPSSERSETVVGVLREKLDSLGVQTFTNANVTSVSKGERFTVETSVGTFEADRVILTSGSEASVKDKNAYTAYDVLKSFGHHVYPVLPALVPLYGQNGYEVFWDGVRIQATVSFGSIEETGELQLTDEGISGIPVFQISHDAVLSVSEGKKTCIHIDFLPHYDMESLIGFLREAKFSGYEGTIRDYLLGWFPKKLVFALSKVYEDLYRVSLKEADYDHFAAVIRGLKRFQYVVSGFGGKEVAQVMQGGLDTAELTENMESRIVPGLFAAGELLDVDGVCGGYNLHFAFASGRIAGEEASK